MNNFAKMQEIGRTSIPDGYRELTNGEKIYRGDLFFDGEWQEHTDCIGDLYVRSSGEDTGFNVTIRNVEFEKNFSLTNSKTLT